MDEKHLLIIIGLGDIAQQLIRILSKDISCIVVDKNPEKKEIFDELKINGEFFTGDATSRLVLKKLPVNDADCIIITTTSEETNIEIASLLYRNFTPRRVISVGITWEGIRQLQDLAVEVEPIFSATALGIRNRLQPKTRAAHGIGLGKGEILEVEIHPHSRLANRPIGSIVPLRWRIGLIYRGENIIIPRKDVVLKPADRIIILGEPSVLKTVSELFTFSFERFPLEYGTMAVVYLSGEEDTEFIEEVKYIIGSFPFSKVFILFPGGIDKGKYLNEWPELREIAIVLRESPKEPLAAMIELFEQIQSEQALIVISDRLIKSHGSMVPLWSDYKQRRFLQQLLESAFCPVIVARGSFPYKHSLVPALEGLNFSLALEKAIEVSSLLNNQVTAFVTEPSRYTASEEDKLIFEEARKEINALSLLHKTTVQMLVRKGNPIRNLQLMQKDYDLIILGSSRWERLGWRPHLIKPDLLWLVLKNTSQSVLLLPTAEEAL